MKGRCERCPGSAGVPGKVPCEQVGNRFASAGHLFAVPGWAMMSAQFALDEPRSGDMNSDFSLGHSVSEVHPSRAAGGVCTGDPDGLCANSDPP